VGWVGSCTSCEVHSRIQRGWVSGLSGVFRSRILCVLVLNCSGGLGHEFCVLHTAKKPDLAWLLVLRGILRRIGKRERAPLGYMIELAGRRLPCGSRCTGGQNEAAIFRHTRCMRRFRLSRACCWPGCLYWRSSCPRGENNIRSESV
jgi:hypothetical protein